MRHTTLLAVSQRAARGFSLLELLVVIGIMALLAGMVIPTVSVVVEGQRRDQAREDLERFAQAITRRTEYLTTDLAFQLKLWQEGPMCDEGAVVGKYEENSETLVRELGILSLVFLLDGNQIGIPFISVAENAAGQVVSGSFSSPGGPLYDQILDPWGRAYVFERGDHLDLPQGERTFLWRQNLVYSSGPNGIVEIPSMALEPAGDDLIVYIHPYVSLAKETIRRLNIVNAAILAYRKDHGVASLGTTFASRTVPAGTIYNTLVAEGYLQEPKLPSDGVTPVPIYAMDAWGFLLISDAQRVGSTFVGPVLSVYSGNLLLPGSYGGVESLPN